MASHNEKGSAEAATSPSRGSNNPTKEMSMNGQNSTNAGEETPAKKMPTAAEFDLIACNLFAIVELASEICMNAFEVATLESGETGYRIPRREGNQLIAMLIYARDAAEAKLGGAL